MLASIIIKKQAKKVAIVTLDPNSNLLWEVATPPQFDVIIIILTNGPRKHNTNCYSFTRTQKMHSLLKKTAICCHLFGHNCFSSSNIASNIASFHSSRK